MSTQLDLIENEAEREDARPSPPSYFERVVAMTVALANASGHPISESVVAEARRILDSEVES